MQNHVDYVTKISELLGHQIDHFPLDGKKYFFSVSGNRSKKPLWVIGHDDGDKIRIHYGDFRDGRIETWFSDESKEITVYEKEHFKRLRTEREQKAKKEERELQKKCVETWLPVYEDSTPSNHPYLQKKQIRTSFNSRVDHNNNLLIPIYDSLKKFTGVQRITPECEKRVSKGTKMTGSFSALGDVFEAKRVYLTEGWATGASVKLALGEDSSVIVAFNANNISPCIKTLRKYNKKCKIIICADNDEFTYIKGNQVNVGLEKASIAKGEFKDVECIHPVFKDKSKKPTDFNDLHMLEGINAVRDQITNHLREFKKKENASKINEVNVVKKLLKAQEEEGFLFVKQQDDVFVYLDGVWKLVEEREQNKIKLKIKEFYRDEATIRKIESTYKHFVLEIPNAPVDMFAPNPSMINFKNCTLHLENRELIKKDHSPEDYCTNQIPVDYTEKNEYSEELWNMLQYMFEKEDPENRKECILAIQEMFGACLLPKFPRVFILKGVPGSGKSTLLKLLMKLMSRDNYSFVQPSEFSGFNLEDMVNKLCNFHTDLNEYEPIKEDVLKLINDGSPIKISRKFMKSLISPIPAVHVFACNNLPPISAGQSGAFDRRITLVEMKRAYVGSDNMPIEESERENFHGLRDKAEGIFNDDPMGVIKFALDGLKRILENENYTCPMSGRVGLAEWQEEEDPLIEFLNDDCYSTGIKIGPTEDFKIERSKLGKLFVEWQKDAVLHKNKIGKGTFYKRIYEKFGKKTVKGKRYVMGITESQPRDSEGYAAS